MTSLLSASQPFDTTANTDSYACDEAEHAPAPPVRALDPRALRDTLAAFPTGVVSIAALVEGERVGMLANSFTSVSLDPPLVSVSIGKHSPTLTRLRAAPFWGISVLGEHQDVVFEQLSRRSDLRFSGVATCDAPDGAVLVPGASADLVVERVSQVDAGDHVLWVLRVVRHSHRPLSRPLVFRGSRRVRLDPEHLAPERAL